MGALLPLWEWMALSAARLLGLLEQVYLPLSLSISVSSIFHSRWGQMRCRCTDAQMVCRNLIPSGTVLTPQLWAMLLLSKHVSQEMCIGVVTLCAVQFYTGTIGQEFEWVCGRVYNTRDSGSNPKQKHFLFFSFGFVKNQRIVQHQLVDNGNIAQFHSVCFQIN